MSQIRERNKTKIFIDIYDMFLMVTGFMNYGQQTVRAARYIGQSFMIILSHANRVTPIPDVSRKSGTYVNISTGCIKIYNLKFSE